MHGADLQLASTFDAVVILVPNDLHERLAVEAFAARKHVLLEKPMALNEESCQRILQAAASAGAGCVFMVGENAAFWPEVLAVKREVDSGRHGRVLTARAKCVESVAGGEWARSARQRRNQRSRTNNARCHFRVIISSLLSDTQSLSPLSLTG